MADALSAILADLVEALDPLAAALGDPDEFLTLLEDLGWRVELDAAAQSLLDANGPYRDFADLLAEIADAIAGLQALAARIKAGDDLDLDEILALGGALTDIARGFSALEGPGAPTMPAALARDEIWQSLARDLPDLLVYDHLAVSHPQLHAIATALGVIEIVDLPAAGPLRREWRRRVVHWDAFAALIADPIQHLREVYRWGGAAKPGDSGRGFAAQRFLETMRRLAASAGIGAEFTRLDPSIIAAHMPGGLPPGALANQLMLPLMRGRHPAGGAYDLTLVAAPLFGANAAPNALLLTNLAHGTLAAEQAIAPGWQVSMTGALDASFALEMRVAPEGVSFEANLPAPPTVTLAFTGTPPADPGVWPLLGPPDGTGIALSGFGARLGVGPGPGGGPEIRLGATLSGLAFTLAPGEGDGLLDMLLAGARLGAEVDLEIDYGTASGLTIGGSGGLSAVIPIDRDLGPIHLGRVEIALEPEAGGGLALSALLSGSATIGPIFAAVERVGVEVALIPAAGGAGMIGPFDLALGFVPPSGYALALDLPAIEGGGYVSVDGSEYRGALALRFESLGFSAFAILNTELPGGRPGFSLAASIFGEFSLPLPYGFFLTGLGGMLGLNRTVDTDALREVLFAGRMDNLIFPADPIASASSILADMAAVLPAREGQHFIGPVARISWGQPALVNITLGVVIEVGAEVRVLILGGLSSILPNPDVALISLTLSFFGEIDFAAGTISFDASLEGSRVLSFTITGDTAIRTGWGPGITHIASFGGLNPRYPKPANLPDLRRLSISFGGNNPKLTFSAYQAITANSLQFGARADLFAKGPKVPLVGQVAAEGFISFDALITFNPFEFIADLAGGLSILVDGDVKAGLFFALTLRGPNTFCIDGKVWVKLLGVRIEFGIRHTWGSRQNLPPATASAVERLRLALENGAGFAPVVTRQGGGAAFRLGPSVEGLLDPVGGLRLVQKAVPLEVTLQKLGEANLIGPKRLELVVYADATAAGQSARVDVTPCTEEFVRGHYFAISKDERLRAPAMERHVAGFDLSSDTMLAPPREVGADYAWEVVPIGLSQPPRGGGPGLALFDQGLIARAGLAYRTGRGPVTPAALSGQRPADRVTVTPTSYLGASGVDRLATASGGDATRIGAALAAPGLAPQGLSDLTPVAKRAEETVNPVVAAYLGAA